MTKRPFGTYCLPAWARFIVSICQKIPVGYLGKRLVYLLRKPVLLIKQQPIDAEINGARFRLFTGENLSDKRLLCTPDLLDGEERRFFNEVIAPNGWLIDVGANIGGYSLLVAAARNDIKAVAVEADPELAERLSQNVSFSGFEQRISVLRAAATEIPGAVILNRDAVNRGKNTVTDKASQTSSVAETIEVEGLPLLDIMNRFQIERPDVVKLDIEGYELPVLKGFFENAQHDRWPKYIQLEQQRKEELNPAVRYAMQKGYRLIKRTRMNVILEID